MARRKFNFPLSARPRLAAARARFPLDPYPLQSGSDHVGGMQGLMYPSTLSVLNGKMEATRNAGKGSKR